MVTVGAILGTMVRVPTLPLDTAEMLALAVVQAGAAVLGGLLVYQAVHNGRNSRRPGQPAGLRKASFLLVAAIVALAMAALCRVLPGSAAATLGATLLDSLSVVLLLGCTVVMRAGLGPGSGCV